MSFSRERTVDEEKPSDERGGSGRQNPRRSQRNPVHSLHRSVGNQAVESLNKNGEATVQRRIHDGVRLDRSTGAAAGSSASTRLVQRQQSGPTEGGRGNKRKKSQKKVYQRALSKTFSAVRETEPVKRLENDALNLLKENWKKDALKPIIITLGGGVLVITDDPFPLSSPPLPLGSLLPGTDLGGLTANVTLRGLPQSERPYLGKSVGGELSISEPFPASVSAKYGDIGPGPSNAEWMFMISLNPVELSRHIQQQSEDQGGLFSWF